MSAQHLEALAKGNKVRLASARLRHEIKELPNPEGKALVADLLLNPPACLRSTRLMMVLRAIKGIDRVLAERLILRAGIPTTYETRPLRALSLHQRARLARTLREFGKW